MVTLDANLDHYTLEDTHFAPIFFTFFRIFVSVVFDIEVIKLKV